MAVDWDDYLPFDPPYDKPHRELTAAEARADFDVVMGTMGERLQALERLCRHNGVALDGNLAAHDLTAIEAWYRANVEGDPVTDRLRPYWYGVSHDLGLYFGQSAIARYPWLRWELVKRPRSDFAFQQPVIAGFRNAGHAMHHPPIPTVLGIGFRVAFGNEQDGESDYLTEILTGWADIA